MAFLRAAELGSFAAAAKRLSISPAALGQTVKRLEDGFGVRLFNRTTRKMSLTPEGRLLYERCRRPVAELDELARVFDDSLGIVAGPLRLSAPLGFGRRHVLPLISRFMARHPGITVTFDASDALRDFVDDPVDIAFRIMRPHDSSVIARPISRLQAITVAAPSYLRRHGIPRQPRDIAAHSCISYRHPATGALASWMFRAGTRELVLAPDARLIVNDIETGCDAAASGAGLIQPPGDYAAPYLAAGRLAAVLGAFQSTPWTIYLCYSATGRLPLRVRSFVEFARTELGRDQFLVAA